MTSRQARIAIVTVCAVVAVWSLVAAVTRAPYMFGTFVAAVGIGALHAIELRKQGRSDDPTDSDSSGNGTST